MLGGDLDAILERAGKRAARAAVMDTVNMDDTTMEGSACDRTGCAICSWYHPTPGLYI